MSEQYACAFIHNIEIVVSIPQKLLHRSYAVLRSEHTHVVVAEAVLCVRYLTWCVWQT